VFVFRRPFIVFFRYQEEAFDWYGWFTCSRQDLLGKKDDSLPELVELFTSVSRFSSLSDCPSARLGYKTKTFNIGEYRRKNVGAEKTSDFFDPSNSDAVKQREQMAQLALEDLLSFFKDGGQAAIYDGTNTTRARRKHVIDYMQSKVLLFRFHSLSLP
jgi:hypothetical protein